MVKDFDGALQTLQAASNMAELSLDVMYGTVDCLLQNGMIDEAAIQLEMLADVMTSTEALSETGCLKFELLFYKGITAEEVSSLTFIPLLCICFCAVQKFQYPINLPVQIITVMLQITCLHIKY